MPRFILDCDLIDPESGEIIAERGDMPEGREAERVSNLLNSYPQSYELEEAGGGYFQVKSEAGSTKFGQSLAMVFFLLISFIGLAVFGLLVAAYTNIPVEWLWLVNF